MNKKLLTAVLVIALCLSNVGVYAKEAASKQDGKTASTTTKSTESVDAKSSATPSTKKEATEKEEVEETKEATEKTVETTETESTATKDTTTTTDGATSEKDNQGKSKISKEELETKKQERHAARTEAKVYIKEIKEMFKDADVETKKEILAEIAALKKELKDLSIGVFVKGKVVDFEKYDNVEPVIKEERTLIPVRAIMETFDATVDWNAETGTITITKDDKTIIMQTGSAVATVNGEQVTLDVAPEIVKGRTLVPVRFISETLGMDVAWDSDSKTIVIDDESDDSDTTDGTTVTDENSASDVTDVDSITEVTDENTISDETDTTDEIVDDLAE